MNLPLATKSGQQADKRVYYHQSTHFNIPFVPSYSTVVVANMRLRKQPKSRISSSVAMIFVGQIVLCPL